MKKRIDFTHEQNLYFINVWEEYLPKIKTFRKNGPLYVIIYIFIYNFKCND